MRLARTHRRLAVLMSLASLLAFSGGAGVEALSALLCTSALLLALFWQPSSLLSSRLERIWLPLAVLLVIRALLHVFLIEDDVVIPVVDLLFLLLAAEALRSLDAENDARLYALSFALMLAATAYRPGLLFALAFIAYVGLSTVALIYGHLKRQVNRNRVPDLEVPRAFLVISTGLSVVTLLFSVGVFLVFPRVSQGWAGRGEVLATSIAGFADEVSLGTHGSQIYGNPQIVLRVEFPDKPPRDLQSLHWRGRSYDRFDGVRWSRSSRIPPSLAPGDWYQEWGGGIISQKIYGAALDTRILFAIHPVLDVEAESRITPIFDNAGDFLYWGTGAPAYTALSVGGRPSPQDLMSADGGFFPARSYYTQLPDLSVEVQALTDSLLSQIPTAYGKASALERWFQEEFTYTLALPRTPAEATLEHFLLTRRSGHCEYFSTAMAIMLRTQGILTREVNGFLGGEWSDFGEYLAVTQNQAHAWVEVWFPGFGWVPFDPTPAGGGGGLAATSWFWPGRFVFDAIQHRWNKWVLDYSFDTQFTLLQRSRDFVAPAVPDEEGEAGGRGPGLPGGRMWWGLAGMVVLLAWGRWARRRRHGISRESRMFVRLKDACRKAGIPHEALHSPESLAGSLEAVGHPAASASRAVVDGYLEARFSGRPTGEDHRRAMAGALKEAGNLLRRGSFRDRSDSQNN